MKGMGQNATGPIMGSAGKQLGISGQHRSKHADEATIVTVVG